MKTWILIKPDKVILHLATFVIKKINWHVSKTTQKRNLHVNTTNQFIKHNIQKFLSNTNKVWTWLQESYWYISMQHITQPVTKIHIYPSKPPKNTGNIGGKIKPQDTDSTLYKNYH